MMAAKLTRRRIPENPLNRNVKLGRRSREFKSEYSTSKVIKEKRNDPTKHQGKKLDLLYFLKPNQKVMQVMLDYLRTRGVISKKEVGNKLKELLDHEKAEGNEDRVKYLFENHGHDVTGKILNHKGIKQEDLVDLVKAMKSNNMKKVVEILLKNKK